MTLNTVIAAVRWGEGEAIAAMSAVEMIFSLAVARDWLLSHHSKFHASPGLGSRVDAMPRDGPEIGSDQTVDLSRKMNDMSSFKKYKCLTIFEKQKVIESVEEDERKVDVAKAFEIPLSSLSTILKNKEKIFSLSSSRVRKRPSKGNFPRLEQCLVSWMRQCREQNTFRGTSLLKEKVKAFAKELGIQFSASEGWLTNFKKRNVFKKCAGKAQVSTLTFVLSGRTRFRI
ncbi:major centromere autoantigen B [Trichonephila clavipes]|nr:major centromere autoantigen B [Trichonephila clavipes]